MYNKEQKIKFIGEYTGSLNTADVALRIFSELEKYEKEWNADFCTKTAEELQPVIDEIVGLRTKSHWMTLTILREYVKWCMNMKVPKACDGMLNIKAIGLDKVKRQMVGSPMHLQKTLNAIFDPESKETIDILYRCYYWMAFAGIEEADTVLIKNNDIDFKGMEIRYKESNVPIYREAVPAFDKAVTLSYFKYIHPNYSMKDVYRERVPGDLVLRGIKAVVNVYTMRGVLSKRNIAAIEKGDTNMQLSYQRVKLSGLFYKTYEIERLDSTVDFANEAAHMMKGKVYALSRRETLKHKQNRIEHDYTEDYQRWKLAFTI